MTGSAVHDVHMAINLVHRLVYFVPEAPRSTRTSEPAERGYFASRSAPMGAVTDDVVIATFYNFSPLAVRSAMPGMWDAASPAEWQQARFPRCRPGVRACRRASFHRSTIDEARELLDPVVADLDSAANRWPRATPRLRCPTIRCSPCSNRSPSCASGEATRTSLSVSTNQVAPCDCLVWSVSTGRFPLRIAQLTRRWTEQEWADAEDRLRSTRLARRRRNRHTCRCRGARPSGGRDRSAVRAHLGADRRRQRHAAWSS